MSCLKVIVCIGEHKYRLFEEENEIVNIEDRILLLEILVLSGKFLREKIKHNPKVLIGVQN